MLIDYEIELLEKMVKEEQYKDNIPLCTPFIEDFLKAYKESINKIEQLEKEKALLNTSLYYIFEKLEGDSGKCPIEMIENNNEKCSKCQKGDRNYLTCWKELFDTASETASDTASEVKSSPSVKPIYVSDIQGLIGHYECPKCRTKLYFWKGDNEPDEVHEYCDSCKVKIDWRGITK